jgi:hypothetical protein
MTTALEKLQHFQHVRSKAWHAKRHTRAQDFLNRFVRQNVAEIDEIKAKEYIWHTRVTPAERAVYLELKHHLEAMDMNIKGGFKKATVKKQSRTAKKFGSKKNESSSSSSSSSSSKKNDDDDDDDDDDDENALGDNDKDARMAAVVAGCKSAEEALIKRAAIFDLDGIYASPQEECDAIAIQRERQLGAAKLDMILQVRRALAMRESIFKMNKSQAKSWENEKSDARGIKLFKIWKETQQIQGDIEADDILKNVLNKAIELGPREVTFESNDILDRDWALREHIHHLRRLQKEIVERVRSLRYFQAIRSLQNDNYVVKCCSNGQVVQRESSALLSCCGHQGHIDVLRQYAAQNACPSKGCQAPVRPTSIVLASNLGLKSTLSAGKHGTKLTKLCNVLASLPTDERVLVFVQFPDLMDKVKIAIEECGLKTDALTGSSAQKTRVLSEFQNEDNLMKKGCVRVLLLNLGDESASGANLTTANHLVFVHPLVAKSQQKWTQQEAQAVGRVRRYGQNREGRLNGTFFLFEIFFQLLTFNFFCFLFFCSICTSFHC